MNFCIQYADFDSYSEIKRRSVTCFACAYRSSGSRKGVCEPFYDTLITDPVGVEHPAGRISPVWTPFGLRDNVLAGGPFLSFPGSEVQPRLFVERTAA